MAKAHLDIAQSHTPDSTVSAKKLFGLAKDQKVPAFSAHSEYVPEIDENYVFDPVTTEALLAGFAHNRRVMVQGWHGTGKSTHIEQVAARLNWPCIRINLDSHISRMDLIGRDQVVLKDGKQVTEFMPGILPFALENGIALVFDEYDAGRPDVMFVIQRVLEAHGKLTLLDQNRIISPHPAFRLFATTNTVGLGDATGLYHGTQVLNAGQLDRWHIITTLNYLPPITELSILTKRVPMLEKEMETARHMVALANLTREAFKNGDLATVMSPRNLFIWAENYDIFGSIAHAFQLSFLNRCDEGDKPLVRELFQRAFGKELDENA